MSTAVVRMGESHIPSLCEIERLCFPDPWSENALREELENPAAHFLVLTVNGEAVAYLGSHHVGDEAYVTNVAVHPLHRQKGYAKTLLDTAKNEWQDIARIALEVRVSNTPARRLYETNGFVLDGIRPNFYRHPTEDAALYSFYRK